MKPSQLRFAIADLRAMDIPLFIWGPGGIGKSDIVAQDALAQRAAAVARLGLPDTEATAAMAAPLSDGTYYGLCDYRVYLREQVDAMGLPHITAEGVTAYAKPADLPNDPNWRGTIFFDEFCIGNPSQQSPAMQIFLGKGVGAFKLPRHAYLIAASNRQSDRGMFHRLLDPLADRVTHIDLEADLGDWLTWATRAGLPSETPAFLRFRPHLLHSYDPQRKWHAPTSPRGWADVARITQHRSTVEADLIRGRVGDAAGGEYLAFLKLAREMISPDEILKDPNRGDVPTNAAVLYALAEALARRATPVTWPAVMIYARRMPKEYAQCMISNAVLVMPALCNTSEYIDWAARNG